MKESVDKCMLVISNEAVNLNSVMPDETYKEREMELEGIDYDKRPKVMESNWYSNSICTLSNFYR